VEESKMSKCILYRQYDCDENLMYIGTSLAFFERLSGHRSHSHWFDRVSKITLERFDTKTLLLKAEKLAIIKEEPLFNLRHSDTLSGAGNRVLKLWQVAETIGVGRRKLYRMIEDGRFPVRPIKGTKPRLWNGDDVKRWYAGQGK